MVEAFQYWQDRLNDMPPGVESYNLPEAYQFYLDGKAHDRGMAAYPYGMLLDPANADLRAKPVLLILPLVIQCQVDGEYLYAQTRKSRKLLGNILNS